MNAIATTCNASKAQMVIPEDIHKQFYFKACAQFVFGGQDEVAVLQAIIVPGMDIFDSLIHQARQQAQHAGLKRAGIARVIKKVRGHK